MRKLPWEIARSTFNSIYCRLTVFGPVFVLFLNELNMTKTQIGGLLSLYPFTAIMAPFIAPYVARIGYKRTYVTSYAARKIISAGLLFTPLVLAAYGSPGAIRFVVVVIFFFTIARAVAITAEHPWKQEYIPNHVRGKLAATSQLFSKIASLLAAGVAGWILGTTPGLDRFMILFAIGVPFGLAAAWGTSFLPGGAPVEKAEDQGRTAQATEALRDRKFVLYIIGASLISLASGPLTSFLPLFMQEQVGLSSGNVVLLQTGSTIGGLASSFLWGWAADRYGSKPVMLSGVFLKALLPISWLLMPRESAWSVYVALAIAFVQGLAGMGWSIGAGRLLYVSVVPRDKRTGYLPLRFAWLGVVGGFGKLLSGRLLDVTANISGQFLFLTLDPYTILFVVSLIFTATSGILLRRIQTREAVSTADFARLFLRGNPLQALTSLVKFHRAKGERATISTTEDLGQARSPLTVEELLEALDDPRFYVRFEAIVSIARTKPDERLIAALSDILTGDEPALSVIAAWALGRIGEEQALEPLREGLDARYRSIQAHSARSLGSLGDETVVSTLIDRLENESDRGLKLAYASALGKLEAEEAISHLLELLRTSEKESVRMELALALARLVGDEHFFIQLLRQSREDPATATSQAVTALRKRINRYQGLNESLTDELDRCALSLARGEIEEGIAHLIQMTDDLLYRSIDPTCEEILQNCANRLRETNGARLEYVLLALHTLHAAYTPRQPDFLDQMLPDIR